jgi:hypothetical protein
MAAELSLFPDPGEIVKAVAEVLAKNELQTLALANAGVSDMWDAYRKVSDEVNAVMNTGLVAPFAAGWRLHKRLITAAKESVNYPYPTKAVDIRSYGFQHEQPFEIEVRVDGTRRMTLTGGLTLDVTFVQFKGTVRRGNLVAVEAGDSKIAASLTLEGAVILAEAAKSFDLKATLRLKPPVSLLT